jgi:hypothetical protein
MPETVGLPAQAAALAALVALPIALFGPPAGDLPAHLYRTFLVEQGVLVWDEHWYGGHYPLFSYSLLYYFPAALVGNEVLAVVSVVAAAAFFASVIEREWGARTAALRWPAYAFAVAAAGPLFTGTFPYAAGLAAALASLRAFQAGRIWLALAAAAVAVGMSPLAFLFLALALIAVVLARRLFSRRLVVPAVGISVLGLVPGAAVLLFPYEATYPFFQTIELLIVIALAALGAYLAAREPRGWPLALFLLLWSLIALVAFLVPSPVGENITRLRGAIFPLILLAAVLARFRPLWLAVPAVAGALAYNLVPWLAQIPRVDTSPAHESFWRPALDFLGEHHEAGFRVEVVPTAGHWEAYWLPREGFPIARGWYRQLDYAQNRLFYEKPLRPEPYRAWLREQGVRYVLVPDAQLGRMGEEREAELVLSGRSGLRQVTVAGPIAIYEVPRAASILPRGTITLLDHGRIEGRVPSAGSYALHVRWTPHRGVEHGAISLERAADGTTRLVARGPGPFILRIGFELRPP